MQGNKTLHIDKSAAEGRPYLVFPGRGAPVHLKKIRNSQKTDLHGGNPAKDMIIKKCTQNHI